MCTFDLFSVDEKCMGLECRRKGLEESCPLHVGRTGGRWIEMDWRTARPSGPQVGGIHISVLHHIEFLLSFLTLQCISVLFCKRNYVQMYHQVAEHSKLVQ